MSKSKPISDREFENLVTAVSDNLSTLDLSGATLCEANLRGANLEGANLKAIRDDGWDEFEAYMQERDLITEEEEEARLDALLQASSKKESL